MKYTCRLWIPSGQGGEQGEGVGRQGKLAGFWQPFGKKEKVERCCAFSLRVLSEKFMY